MNSIVEIVIPKLATDMSGASKVWIYMADRELNQQEVDFVNENAVKFARHWVSHARDLHAFSNLFYNRFLVLAVDETKAHASGCSVDASVRFVKDLGSHLDVNWFDRMQIAFITKQQAIQQMSLQEFREAFQSGEIGVNTLIFDNLVPDKASFESGWIKKVSESWVQRLVG